MTATTTSLAGGSGSSGAVAGGATDTTLSAFSTANHADLLSLAAAITAAAGVTSAGTPAAASRVVAALASTGVQINVGAATTDTTILAANASRLGFKVFNDSTATLYLLLASSTASATVHTAQVGPGALYEDASYAGIVKGVWSSANGSARVTELS